MDKKKLKEMAGDKRFISGIYNYCDRWCERCPQTSHCLNYAMGEEEFADPQTRDVRNRAFWDKMSENLQTTLEMVKEMAASRGIDLDTLDLNQAEEENDSIREAAENHEISRAALAYSRMVESWFKEANGCFQREDEENAGPRPSKDAGKRVESELEESLEVVRWYQHQIYVKMMRAITGRLEETVEGANEEDRFVKDSDGSAKVALIGIDRSIAAWSIIREAFPLLGGKDTQVTLTHLERLRRGIEKIFPDARGFIRPGFDQIDFNS